MRHADFPKNLNSYNVKFIVFGGYGLYLLNKKFDLDIEVNLKEKDFDVIVKSDENFLRFAQVFHARKIDRKVKANLTLYKMQGNIDLIVRSNFVRVKISDNVIPYLDYENYIKYCYLDKIYGQQVNCLNLEAYYGIINRTGAKKYKPIIKQILAKYPDLKTRVLS